MCGRGNVRFSGSSAFLILSKYCLTRSCAVKGCSHREFVLRLDHGRTSSPTTGCVLGSMPCVLRNTSAPPDMRRVRVEQVVKRTEYKVVYKVRDRDVELNLLHCVQRKERLGQGLREQRLQFLLKVIEGVVQGRQFG